MMVLFMTHQYGYYMGWIFSTYLCNFYEIGKKCIMYSHVINVRNLICVKVTHFETKYFYMQKKQDIYHVQLE